MDLAQAALPVRPVNHTPAVQGSWPAPSAGQVAWPSLAGLQAAWDHLLHAGGYESAHRSFPLLWSNCCSGGA